MINARKLKRGKKYYGFVADPCWENNSANVYVISGILFSKYDADTDGICDVELSPFEVHTEKYKEIGEKYSATQCSSEDMFLTLEEAENACEKFLVDFYEREIKEKEEKIRMLEMKLEKDMTHLDDVKEGKCHELYYDEKDSFCCISTSCVDETKSFIIN